MPAKLHDLGILVVSASRDAEELLTLSLDGALVLWGWSSATTQLEQRAKVPSLHLQPVNGAPLKHVAWSVAMHPSGTMFAATGEGCFVCLYTAVQDDFARGIKQVYMNPFSRDVYGLKVVFNSDGSLLAIGCSNGDVLIFDTDAGVLLATINDHAEPVRTLEFTPPVSWFADQLVVGSDDRSATLHDIQNVRTTKCVTTVAALQGHEGWVLGVACSDDGRIVATHSSDHTVRLWDLATSPKTCVSIIRGMWPIWTFSWRPEELPEQSQALPSTRLMRPGSAFVFGSQSGEMHVYRNAGASAVAPGGA